jgi:hypothetical protein
MSPSLPAAGGNQPHWQRLWDEAVHPADSLVEAYLARRGVLGIVPVGAFGEVLRFHPRCPFGEEKLPAMLALVRAIEGDEPQAIYRTAIERKADGAIKIAGVRRMALGQTKGGAIKLTEDVEVTTCLGIGEGLESTLSLRLTPDFGLSPVWSLINDGGVGGFPVLAGIEVLWIAVDNDKTDPNNGRSPGQHAALAGSARWTDAGRQVKRLLPDAVGDDLNDVIRADR